MALRIPTTLEGMDVQEYLKDLIRKVYQHPLIYVSHDAVITEVSGYVGNFITTVKSEGRIKEIKHGAAILATGADVYRPTEYLYGTTDKVITSVELGEQIELGEESLTNAEKLVMIQCVGCRQEDRNYCSRVCCSHSVKNALKLKEINPKLEIYILFRDMRTYGFSEDYYRDAADKDVKFIRYEPEDKPLVETLTKEGKEILRVSVLDPILGKRLAIDADVVTLAAAVIPSQGSLDVARLFKVTMNQDGFFQEAHVKLRPVDFAADGVFCCGMAHYPKHITEVITQALGAAGRAGTILSQETVTASGSVCDVKEKDCVACGACISVCTYGAIAFHDTPKGKKATVNSVLCKGDGLCNAVCPTAAISLKHYTDEELLCQIDAATAI